MIPPQETPSLTVAVSGLNNIDSPGPGVPVIRALRRSNRWNLRVIGLSYDSLEPGLYMHDLVDKSYQLPLPTAGTEALLERLRYIQEYEKIQVLIPNFDAELHNFIRLSTVLRSELGIHTFLPDLQDFDARHKAVLHEFGDSHGIKVPAAHTVFTLSDFHQALPLHGFPVVVKGKYYDAVVAHSADEALSAFYKISAKWGLPVLLQDYVRGNEVNVTALGDGKGGCVGAVPMRKLYITDKGKAWAGVSIEDEALMKQSRALLASCRWKGPCELEFMRTDEGHYYLMEMNPRFPAWVYLACGCGQNHPEALVQLALGGEPEEMQDYQVGKMFVRYSQDLIVDLQEFEQISTQGEL
jgi:carbamoyl-phosphate synthase large subunit